MTKLELETELELVQLSFVHSNLEALFKYVYLEDSTRELIFQATIIK